MEFQFGGSQLLLLKTEVIMDHGCLGFGKQTAGPHSELLPSL